MNITQQIKQVVEVINDLKLLHSGDKQIPIHPKEDLPDIPIQRIDLILKKLQNEEKIIKYVQSPAPQAFQLDHTDNWFQCFIIEPTDKFFSYIQDIGTEPTPKKPPKGWELDEDDRSLFIRKNSKDVYTFPYKTSKISRIFKYLWGNLGINADYESVSQIAYHKGRPDKKDWLIYKDIKSEVNSLRNKKDFKALPMKIITNKGFLLDFN